MSSIVAVPFGEPALASLEALLAAAKTGDALAPVTVVVPSNYAGLSLRRLLGPRGLVNVRFLVLDRVAELLGAGEPADGRRPLGAWQRSEAVRAALALEPGVFRGVANHPATVRALDATFRELGAAHPGALDELANQSARGRDIVALFRRFRDLTAGYYDGEDLAAAAVVALRKRTGALRDLGLLIFYLPRRLSPARTELVRAFLEANMGGAILGLAGDPVADAGAADLAAQLGLAFALPAGKPPFVATSILRAVDIEEEVRGVVRLALAAVKDGTPLHRIGVLFASAGDYAGLLHEQFAAAGIPVNGPPTLTLAETMPGRVLLGALALPETGFRRTAVMEWLTSGPVLLDAGDRRADAHRWDEVSRDAGVVKGVGQWGDRLRAWAADSHRTEFDRETAHALTTFIDELAQRLQPPAAGAAGELAAWALELVERYLGGDGVAANWDSEFDASARSAIADVLSVIAATKALADPRTGVRLTPFRGLPPAQLLREFGAVLAQALSAPAARQGAFGDGVFCGNLANARGMTFEHLFVVGMVEGSIPQGSREDALLPDTEREAAGLPERAAMRAAARADYLAALACAPRRTLCFAQSSLSGQAKQLPSRWLLESASALAGRPVSSEDFLRLRREPWLTAVASFDAALASTALEPASGQEWELRSLRRADAPDRHFLAKETPLGRGFASATARLPRWARRFRAREDELSPFAGGVGLSVSLDEGRVYSATSLETFATCGFQYFLKDVIRVKPTARPEHLNRMSAADRGTLIHDALERFFTEVDGAGRNPGPRDRWTVTDLDHLLSIASEECATASARGITGGELLWRVDEARIRRDLTLFLDADNLRRAESGATFLVAERKFQSPERDAEPGESWPPVAIGLERDMTIRFHGRIDRVDRRPDGSLIVYDYKSGGSHGYEAIGGEGDNLDGGRRLQLPIYALAARQALGMPDTPVESHYWFVSEREAFRHVGYALTTADEDGLRTTLSALAGTAEAGLFPAVPGKRDGFPAANKNCRYCDFDRTCAGGDRLRAWTEQKGLPALAGYVGLSGTPEPEEVSDAD